jgi:ribosomal protein S27AE
MLKIPKDLLDTLLELRADQLRTWHEDEFFTNNNVVVLSPWVYAQVYLGLDGRVFMLDQANPTAGVRETTDPRILAGGLRICANRYRGDLDELFTLMPSLPEPEAKCPQCDGQGTLMAEWAGAPMRVVCPGCGGLGWQRPL